MNIQETTFGPKKYLTLKKSITTSQVSDKQMYDEAGKKLGAYMQQNGLKPSGAWSVLYFMWDEANAKTDIGIAFPMDGLDSVSDPDLTMVEIPESKAAVSVLRGPYTGLSGTHQALMQYVSKYTLDEKNVPVMAVEEYAVDPSTEPNPEKLITNIYYLHN